MSGSKGEPNGGIKSIEAHQLFDQIKICLSIGEISKGTNSLPNNTDIIKVALKEIVNLLDLKRLSANRGQFNSS